MDHSRRSKTFPPESHVQGSVAYRYRNLHPGSKSIRVLELDPEVPTEVISIQLHTIHLPTLFEYNAISYVWGDSRQKIPITCEEEPMHVTTNLRDALIRIRIHQEPAMLWADALCIDQKNLQERSHQVSLMTEIYQGAKVVWIYLGSDEEGHAEHIKALLDEVSELRTSKTFTLEGHPISRDPRWPLLRVMLDEPWFYRTWVIQEAALARDPRILYGNVAFDFRDVLNHASWLRESSVKLYSTLNLDLHIAWAQNWAKTPANPNEDFYDLLNHARYLGCTEEKDRIYAFLSHPLARIDGGGNALLRPDYEKPYLDVYRELAIKGILQSNTALRLLSAVEHTEQTLSANFSSWVPRWNVTQTLDTLGLNSRHYYTASKTVGNRVPNLVDHTLRANGCIFDHVLETFLLPFQRYKNDALSQAAEPSVEKSIEALWRSVSSRYKTTSQREIHIAAFRLTLTAGMFGEEDAEDISNSASHQSDFDMFGAPQSEYRNGNDTVTTPVTETIGSKSRFEYGMRLACTGRCFIITQQGYYGLAPLITKQGDLCCVLNGTKVPYILRKSTEQSCYKLIGEAYIHGFMRGEVAELITRGECTVEELVLDYRSFV
ncbi:heterokaryon incompatibility protein-domain-containing protein [Hyaloscypha finlandica]|nr:heterokaryon incompatibility protein-domain-containing protein [Hyaloscypha finlandica]